jgi:mannose-6-phosphate isomerase-like protein (cupin superfamily)
MKKIALGSAVLCLAAATVSAADAPKSAAYITPDDVQKVVQANGGNAQENSIRMVDMDQNIQMSTSLLHRGSTEGERPPAAAAAPRAPRTPCGEAAAPAGAKITSVNMLSHDDISEIYIITKGTATMVTGGTIFAGAHQTDSKTIGPTCGGKAYGDVETRELKVGDIVEVPQGVPHGFARIPGDLEYYNFRLDPKHVLPPIKN